jgi:uncharacterized membrane protein YfhO
MKGAQGEASVIQFKKQTGVLTAKGIYASTIEIVILSTYEYTANPVVTIGGVEVTLPDPATINAAAEDTGMKNDKGYAIKRYTVVVELEAPMAGDLVISNTQTYAMYMESIKGGMVPHEN